MYLFSRLKTTSPPLFQKVGSVSTVAPPLPLCGDVTATATISVTPVVSTTRWTDKTDLSSSPREDWWVLHFSAVNRPICARLKENNRLAIYGGGFARYTFIRGQRRRLGGLCVPLPCAIWAAPLKMSYSHFLSQYKPTFNVADWYHLVY